MTAKLNIDLKQGLLHVEGTEEFVRAIYDDFKTQLTAAATASTPPPPQRQEPKSSGKGEIKRTASKANGKRTDFEPTFNRDLDTAKLAAFYNQYELSNHAEKILVFCMFLKDVLKQETITGSDIFTCYSAIKAETKTPKAFAQALRDAHGKSHYIEVRSWDDIVVPISGSNFFNHDIKRKGIE
jgi:hypothetical protein